MIYLNLLNLSQFTWFTSIYLNLPWFALIYLELPQFSLIFLDLPSFPNLLVRSFWWRKKMIVIGRSDQKLAFLAIFTIPNHAKPHQTYPNLLVRSFWWRWKKNDRNWKIGSKDSVWSGLVVLDQFWRVESCLEQSDL